MKGERLRDYLVNEFERKFGHIMAYLRLQDVEIADVKVLEHECDGHKFDDSCKAQKVVRDSIKFNERKLYEQYLPELAKFMGEYFDSVVSESKVE